jgi:hypothetical protein
MFCPCCTGHTPRSIHHVDQSGNVDGNNHSPAPEQSGIHRISEPCKLRIPSDLLGAPFPVTVNLVNVPRSLSFRRVLIIHSSPQNSFATVYPIGYTKLGYNGTKYGVA